MPFHQPFRFIKKFLPKTMFGRSLLILLTPLVVVQTISAYIFFDRHWDSVTKSLASNIAGNVRFIVDLYQKKPSNLAEYQHLAKNHLSIRIQKGHTVTNLASVPSRWQGSVLDQALNKKLDNPYTFNITHNEIIIRVLSHKHILQFVISKKRLYSKTTFLFVMWTAGTSIFFLFVAAIFMHNQVKPLRRLAIAADRFGKGRRAPHLRPEGAIEIRKLSQAFLTMRERLYRQMTQRTEMLAGVSHDLRTPLTRMRLQIAMLPSSSGTEGLLKDVTDMEMMVEGYLAFVRGEGEEETKNLSLQDIINDTISSRLNSSKPVIFTPFKKKIILPLRQHAFKRCLGNLINNSHQYADQTWISVKLNNDLIHILVEDDGSGIPEDKREVIFKPFYRLDASRNRATGGVGLGLTIARDITRSHGGDLVLSSSIHGGLCATIILPL